MRTFRCWLCVAMSSVMLLSLMHLAQGAEPRQDEYLVYVGTYTRGSDSEGIYRFRLNTQTGEMTDVALAGKSLNPSFLTVHPSRRYLYSVSEIQVLDGRPTGGVASFRIDPQTGDLSPINVEGSGGRGPCYVTTDTDGRSVLVANYGGGSVASLPIRRDGGLKKAASVIQHTGSSVNQKRQQAPHAHSIRLSPDNRHAYAPDLGTDKVMIYDFDSQTSRLLPHQPPHASVAPGSGPRHFDFHPNGKFAYVINELAMTITAFAFDARTGNLKEIQTVPTVPDGPQPGYSTADIHVHPSGKFLYGSNRGHNTIVVFEVDEKTGKLTYVQHQSTMGETPRNFGIDPTGRILLAENQNSGTIYSFRINEFTGKLSWTNQMIKIPKPVCVQFVPWPIR